MPCPSTGEKFPLVTTPIGVPSPNTRDPSRGGRRPSTERPRSRRAIPCSRSAARVAASEVGLVPSDHPAEPGLQRRDPGPSSWPCNGRPASRRNVSRPQPCGFDPRLAQRIPQARSLRGGDVQLDPVLARVAGAGDHEARPRARPRNAPPRPRRSRPGRGARARLGPCTASTARVAVTSANSTASSVCAKPSANAASSSSVFDAFGITKKRSASTHHTMMSSTTCASCGSRRCVYCARPHSILRRSFVSSHCSSSNAPGPRHSTVPRWETSNTTARARHARCSSSTPAYCRGMSQPPNGTMRAPRARCCASSGL